MTNKEARNILLTSVHPQTSEEAEAIGIAVKAVERMIPKKPKVPIDTWLCPSCGKSVEYQQKLGDNVLYQGQHDFCPDCGQAIDWSE